MQEYKLAILNKISTSFLLIIVLLSGCSSFEESNQNLGKKYLQATPEAIRNAWENPSVPHIFVVAHRANTAYINDVPNAPENSLKAIEIAINHGVDVIEVDLKQTIDGHFVLMHDQKVGRTTNGKGRVDEMTLKEVKQLRLVNNGIVTDEQVPTLEETLELIDDRVMIFLDHIHESKDLDSVLNIVNSYDMLDQTIFTSRESPESVPGLFQGYSMDEIHFMPLINASNMSDKELLELIKEYKETVGMSVVCLVFDEESGNRMTKELFYEIKGLNLRIWINTLWNGRISGGYADEDLPEKSNQVLGELIQNGIDIIQTDQAAYTRAYITSPHFKNNVLQGLDSQY